MDIDLEERGLKSCMKCNTFEEKLSEYFDGILTAGEASLFRAHALQCRSCRSLMDEVKATIQICGEHEKLNTPAMLETALMAISREHAVLDCDGFEMLVTEFLDGFLPAPTYHRFEEHAGGCCDCSLLLTEVVYAVAACHSVHTFEEVEPPSSLIARMVAVMPARKPTFARRVAGSIGMLVDYLIPNPARAARWTFATSLTLGVAMLALLFLGFSDDGTVAGIYRQAQVKVSELYSHSTDVYIQTDKAVAKLETVRYRIGEFWDTLGGETESQGGGNASQPNSSKRIESDGKN